MSRLNNLFCKISKHHQHHGTLQLDRKPISTARDFYAVLCYKVRHTDITKPCMTKTPIKPNKTPLHLPRDRHVVMSRCHSKMGSKMSLRLVEFYLLPCHPSMHIPGDFFYLKSYFPPPGHAKNDIPAGQ